MKAILIMSLLALSFATGFTCSKNPPQEPAPETSSEVAPQEQMTAPTESVPAQEVPAEGQPSTTESAPAPTGENK